MLYNFLLGIETILSIIIVVLILLHRGRGSEAGAVFTGSASASVFGSRGSTPFLTKLIASLAFVFILNSLSLAYIANRDFGGGGSVIEEANIEEVESPIDGLPADDADDLPIDQGVYGDEDIDDIPGNAVGTEYDDSISDTPTLDEGNEAQGDMPLINDSPAAGEDSSPIDEGVYPDENNGDIPSDAVETEYGNSISDIPTLDEGNETQEDMPLNYPADETR